MSEQHTVVWVDIPVTDLNRAVTFYQAVLDKEVKQISEHGFEFALLPHENDNVSACLCVIENRQPSTQGALIYLNVEGRLEHAVAKVKSLGQTVVNEAEQIGPYGRRAIIIDTEGNGIALYSKS